MDAVWKPLKLETGMWPDIAPEKAKGFCRSGQWVRWRGKQLQPIGGNQKASTDQYVGTARNIFEFQDNDGYTVNVVATHKHVHAMFDGDMYLVTPVEEYLGPATGPITTVAGSSTFTYNRTAHGFVTGMYIRFPTSPTVDGVTLNASYYEITKIDADNFSFNAGANASAGGSALGGAYLDTDVFLRPGLENSLSGAGYGTGAFDTGLYGGTLASEYKARTWTGGAIGELWFGCPRGGKIYGLGPSFSTWATELVTNGTFTGGATSWTLGAGWAYGSNAISATTSSAAAEQNITVEASRWIRIKFTITAASAGTLQVSLGGVNIGSTYNTTGRKVLEYFNPTGTAQALKFTGSGFTGTIDNVSVMVADTMVLAHANAPTQNTGITTTHSGQIMAYGTIDPDTSAFDPLVVRTCDIDDFSDWTTTASNAARTWYLYGGQLILGACHGEGSQVFIGTNEQLWEAQYVGPPTYFEFRDRGGPNTGVLGPDTMAFHNGRLYFVSTTRKFRVWDGVSVTDLFCPGEDEVMKNLAWVQSDIAHLWVNPYDEVWFCYADQRDGTEVSRMAVIMQPKDEGRWTFGEFPSARTAFMAQSAAGYPMMAGGGYLYYHEYGDDSDGAQDVDWSARYQTPIGNGNTLWEVSGIMPDVSDQEGPFNVRLYGYENLVSDTVGPITDSGEVSITTSNTRDMTFFVEGRAIDLVYSGVYGVKIGDPLLLMRDTGNQY